MKLVKKLFLVIAILIILVIAAIVALGCALLIPSDIGVGKDELTHSYGTVLADIEGIKETNPRLIDIAFFASHDSFSSLITPDSGVEHRAPNVAKKLLPLIKNYSYRFSVTQNAGIYDQIMEGVRFLHIKVSVYNGEWYTAHTLLSGTLETHLKDVLKFLTSDCAKGEIVGILFQPVDLGNYKYADMHEYIDSVKYEGKSLYDFVNYDAVDAFNEGKSGVKINEIRYDDITQNGAKAGVVLFDRRDGNRKDSWDEKEDAYPYSFDMDSNAIHVWHDSSSSKKLNAGITETCDKIKSDEKNFDLLRMNQTQASLSVKSAADIWGDVTSYSLLKIAKKHNVSLIERDDFNEILSVMPVFQTDYVTSSYGDFNKKANALIRAYNENLCK